MKRLPLLLLLLTGCATNSGIIPTGQNTYMISRQQATGFEGQGNMRSDNILDATYYCSLNNKIFQIVRIEENEPPYILGKFPKSSLEFKCLSTAPPPPPDHFYRF